MSSAVKVFRPTGVLNSTNGMDLREDLNQAIAAGARIILIDCQDLNFMDSSGLGVLVMMLKKVREAKGTFALCNLNKQVQMVLELTNMDNVFQIFPNREAFEKQFMGS